MFIRISYALIIVYDLGLVFCFSLFFFFFFCSVFFCFFFFFFSSRRRHTRYIGDWSSDVCSSDLINKALKERCPDMDQAAAALIRDLKRRGLLDTTLVVWGGEFGRTPVSESGDGRDHNPYGYTMWVAGGGFKGGLAYGMTDEFGFKAVENRVSIHDLHATLLNQLGVDHTRLTYRYAGRDFRLTDVFGEVVNDILT